jgi:hypothetical protein
VAVSVLGTGFSITDTTGCTITSGTPASLIINAPDVTCSINTSTGRLTGTFKVGANSLGGAGPIQIIVTGTAAGDTPGVGGIPTFTVIPNLVLSSISGSTGSNILFAGSGFTATFNAAAPACAGFLPGEIGGLPVGNPSSCNQDVLGNVVGSFTVDGAPLSGTFAVTYTDKLGVLTKNTPFTKTGGPIVTLSELQGPVGFVVTVTGSGFNVADTSVSISDAAAGLFAPSPFSCLVSGGTIAAACRFTVAATSGGLGGLGFTVTATGNTASDSSAASFLVLATLKLTPDNGGRNPTAASGTLVQLTGSGYLPVNAPCVAPTEAPALSAAVPALVCNIDLFGVLTGQFNVLNTAVPGLHTFSIISAAQVPQTTVSASFTVTEPTITFTPTNSGSGGDTINFSGSGFSTGDAGVCASFALTAGTLGTPIAATPLYSCNISSGGVATGSFVVVGPNNGAEVKTLTLTGSQGDAASADFSVVPKITLSPNPARVGATVTVTGTNFATKTPPAAVCTISGLSVVPASVVCTTDGAYDLIGSSFTVPVTFGELSDSVTVTDFDTVTAATATLNIVPHIITPTPNAGPRGSTVSITGSGFAVGDAGACTFTGSTNLVGATIGCVIGIDGTVTGSFIVKDTAPAAAYGANTIEVDSTVGGDFGTATFTVTAAIVLFPTVGRVGATVLITGSGFDAADTGCAISSTLGGLISSPVCNVAGGVMSGTFIVAGVSSGLYNVTVTGNLGDYGFAPFTVPGASTLILSQPSGPTGTGISASGSKYQGTTCLLTSSPSGLFTSQSCTLTSGTLAGSFNVASGAATGTAYTVTAQTNAGAGDSASANFAVTVGPSSTLKLTPPSGPISAVISGTGAGFTTDTTCTLISAPAGVLSSPSCTVAGGNATIGFTVPLSALAGTYTLLALGNQGHSAGATFQVTSGPTGTLTLTPPSGPINAVVSGVGTGFTSDATCLLSSAPATILSSPSCAISAAKANVGFAVSPNALAGTYTIFVLGSAGTSASATFTVTAGANPSFTLSTNPSTMTLNQGGVGTVSVTVQSINQFNSAVTLAAPTLPAGVSAGFSSNPVTPPAGGSTISVLTLTATNTAPATTTVITVTGTGGGVTASAGVTLIVSVTTTATTVSTSVVTSTGPWNPPSCVIATATFGSEAAPAVQFLRGFRDNLVLKTQAGSAFMQPFNAWYYSFSPSVAQFIANHDPVRAPVRVLLYPLLGVLDISASTYSLFSASPEFAVVIAGLIASSLIGLVYLTPFTFLSMRALTRRRRIRTISIAKASLLVLAAALGLLAAGELAGSFLMLAVASSAIVLTCIIAAPTIVALLMLRPKSQ